MRVFVSKTDAKSSVFTPPGRSSPSTPRRIRSTAATCSRLTASTIISSSSTPSERGGDSPKWASITRVA